MTFSVAMPVVGPAIFAADCRTFDGALKVTHFLGAATFDVERLPTDSIGSSTVAFLGVNAGCEIRVFLPSGVETAGIESCVADQVLTWPVYSPGNSNNNVTIRIVGNAFKIKEFPYTTQPGSVTLPVQQELDRWYSNPA